MRLQAVHKMPKMLVTRIGIVAAFFINFSVALISLPPQDTTTTLGNAAVFNCIGEGDLLNWTREGDTITEQIKQQYQISIVHHNVSDDMVSSSLYINATLDNDGVTIGCIVVNDLPLYTDSKGADLHVRRISPVRDLSLSIDDVPYVTWTIPSVIATDIPVSDIRYTVTLEGGNITSTVNDIDDTYYQFTDITVLNCTVYTATVTAYNVYYPMDDLHISQNDTINNTIVQNITVEVDREVHVYILNGYVDFTIMVNSSCPVATNAHIVYGGAVFNIDNGLNTTSRFKFDTIQRKGKIIGIAGSNNFSVESMPQSFTTFHVQDFIFINNIATCIFAIGSNAAGCLVKFTEIYNKNQQNIPIYKNGYKASSNINTVPNGAYNVTVYDIVADSEMSDDADPAYYGQVNITTFADTPSPDVITISSEYIVPVSSIDDIVTSDIPTGTAAEAIGSTVYIITIIVTVIIIIIIIANIAIICFMMYVYNHHHKMRKVNVRRDLAALRNPQAHNNLYGTAIKFDSGPDDYLDDRGEFIPAHLTTASHDEGMVLTATEGPPQRVTSITSPNGDDIINDGVGETNLNNVDSKPVHSGSTPLHVAAKNGTSPAVFNALSNGADVNITDRQPLATRAAQYADISTCTIPGSTIPPVPPNDEAAQYATIAPHDVVKDVMPPIPSKKKGTIPIPIDAYDTHYQTNSEVLSEQATCTDIDDNRIIHVLQLQNAPIGGTFITKTDEYDYTFVPQATSSDNEYNFEYIYPVSEGANNNEETALSASDGQRSGISLKHKEIISFNMLPFNGLMHATACSTLVHDASEVCYESLAFTTEACKLEEGSSNVAIEQSTWDSGMPLWSGNDVEIVTLNNIQSSVCLSSDSNEISNEILITGITSSTSIKMYSKDYICASTIVTDATYTCDHEFILYDNYDAQGYASAIAIMEDADATAAYRNEPFTFSYGLASDGHIAMEPEGCMFFDGHAVFHCNITTGYHLSIDTLYNDTYQQIIRSGSATSIMGTGTLLVTKDNNGSLIECITTPDTVLERPLINTVLRSLPDSDGGCGVTAPVCGQGSSGSSITTEQHLQASTSPQHDHQGTSGIRITLTRAVADVLNTVLQDIVGPEETLRQFAGYLYQAHIINRASVHNPTYHDIIDTFIATLCVLTTIDDIEEHCQKFIDALRELGGTGATQCADILREEWRTAAKSIGYNSFLDVKGKVGATVQSTQQRCILDMTPKKRDLLELLSEISYKWYSIGTMLEVRDVYLENLRQSNLPNGERLLDTLQCWMDTKSSPVTWRTIIDVLRNDYINRPRVAYKIQYKLLTELYHKYKAAPRSTDPYKVLKHNLTKISNSDVDVFKLADSLYSSDAIPEPFYKDLIDMSTGQPASTRLQALMSHVITAVKSSRGSVFDKLLTSLRKIGQSALADDLYQQYTRGVAQEPSKREGLEDYDVGSKVSINNLLPINMLIRFLEELNKTLLDIPHTNLALRKEISLLNSEQLLFFPALIAEKRPQDIGGKFKVGWCLKFTSGYSSSIRFLHIILLHFAYQFSEAVSTRKAAWVPSGPECRCSVWNNGIHWYNNDGIEALVEQVEDNRYVMVLMSCDEETEDMIQLHPELIKTILCLQQEYCPTLNCEEYLLSPSDFQHTLNNPSEVVCYNMEWLKSQIRKNKGKICDSDSRHQPVKISELLPVEPKRYLEIMDSSSSDTDSPTNKDGEHGSTDNKRPSDPVVTHNEGGTCMMLSTTEGSGNVQPPTEGSGVTISGCKRFLATDATTSPYKIPKTDLVMAHNVVLTTEESGDVQPPTEGSGATIPSVTNMGYGTGGDISCCSGTIAVSQYWCDKRKQDTTLFCIVDVITSWMKKMGNCYFNNASLLLSSIM